VELKDLARLVAELRHAQKEFFRTKSQTALQEAKKLEAKVDRVLETIDEGQKTLF
jgi:ABC-type Zn uptake system ZnuABC Zn-binding protein ZnuA